MNVYKKAILTFGKEHQLVKALEELTELQTEIHKFLKQKVLFASTKDNLIEEIADVRIMLKQLELIIGSSEEIKAKKKEKLERLERVIKSLEND